MPKIQADKDTPINKTNPGLFFRSNLIKFKTQASFESELNFTVFRLWRIFELDTNDELFIEENPTIYSQNLVIRSNTLNFKRYKIIFFLTMKLDTGYLQSIQNEFTTALKLYINVIPSGIQVFGLQNGIDYIIIGKSQSVTLNPSKFSFDMDDLVPSTSLKFKIYCRLVGLAMIDAEFNTTEMNDLKSQKYSGKLDINSCFNSTGLMIFSSLI